MLCLSAYPVPRLRWAERRPKHFYPPTASFPFPTVAPAICLYPHRIGATSPALIVPSHVYFPPVLPSASTAPLAAASSPSTHLHLHSHSHLPTPQAHAQALSTVSLPPLLLFPLRHYVPSQPPNPTHDPPPPLHLETSPLRPNARVQIDAKRASQSKSRSSIPRDVQRETSQSESGLGDSRWTSLSEGIQTDTNQSMVHFSVTYCFGVVCCFSATFDGESSRPDRGWRFL